MRYVASLTFFSVLLVAGGCDSTQFDARPPDFVLQDLEGNAFQFSSTQGKVVLLTFFAPWCSHCQAEAPVLAELHETYGDDGLEIVAVATQAESMDQIRQFRDGLDVPYRILVDDGRVSSRAGYDVRSVPTTFVIDRGVKLHGPYGHQSREAWLAVLQPLL